MKWTIITEAIFREEKKQERIIYMKRIRKLLPKATIIIIAIVLLLLPACSNGKAPVSSQIESYTIADSTGDWGYPSPYAHYSRGPGYVRMSFVFETLVWKDVSVFTPQLAEEWEYVAEENAYIFKLRNDVTWHDGTKFTADDVVFTFDYTRKHLYQWVDNSIVKSAEAIDQYTVKLYLSKPYAPFFQDVAGTQPIMPRHIWENIEEPEKFVAPEAVIGTGPYTLADYSKEHGTYLYKVYNDYYLGKPFVDEIKFVKISAEMIPAALKEGSVSAGDIPPEVVSEMEDAGLTVITAPVAWNAKMTINHHKEPLSSTQFRQALAYAINREALVQITQRGHALAGSPGMMPPTSDWYNPDIPQYEYDPARAKQFLEGLGYQMEGGYFTRDGEELSLELIAAADYKEVGQFIKQQLEEAGVKINFITMEAKTVDAKVGAWDFDLSVYGHGGLYEPSFLKRVIMDEKFNSARYTSNETLNQLLKAQLTEMDAENRKDLVFQIQEVYAEDLPALTLYYPKWYWAHDGTVNLFYTMDGMASGIPIPLNRMAFVK
ncbi:MAG: ABC transporter substrate-binding protein [Chloroflexota bacterium]|nr:ABC transporter substrate-binding protein [Chloroflexota bacterium]